MRKFFRVAFKLVMVLAILAGLAYGSVWAYQNYWPSATAAAATPVQAAPPAVVAAPVNPVEKVPVAFHRIGVRNPVEFEQLLEKLSDYKIEFASPTARDCRKNFDYERFASLKVLTHGAEFNTHRVWVELTPRDLEAERSCVTATTLHHVLYCLQDEWSSANKRAVEFEDIYNKVTP